jgi:hypothetical protein
MARLKLIRQAILQAVMCENDEAFMKNQRSSVMRAEFS